jgi:hypothetical protein
MSFLPRASVAPVTSSCVVGLILAHPRGLDRPPASVGLSFQQADTRLVPGDLIASRHTIVLTPGETRTLENPLSTVFELDAEIRSRSGSTNRSPTRNGALAAR